ncbi:MAG: hypothetical protein U9O87_06345 [Verrucomicrobiota bacterium]|nr:hypothetical protein [Verrucomicrobiota bacterium]
MAKSKNPGRITFSQEFFNMPFSIEGGFHALNHTLSLEKHQHSGFEITDLAKGEVK